MKVLAVFSRLLYPPIDGYKLREYHLLRHLKHHCEITPLVFEEPGVSPADRQHFLREFPSLITRPNELLLRHRRPGLSQRLRNLLTPSAGLTPGMQETLSNELEAGKHDVVYVAGLSLLPYFAGHKGLPVVADLCDDPTILSYQLFRAEPHPIKKARLLKGWLHARTFMRSYVSRLDHLIVASPVDARSVARACPDSRVHILPNGVDTEYFRPNGTPPEPATLCFTGVMSYEPNDDAMRYFCREIYPRVKHERPDVQLLIVGKNPSAPLLALTRRDASIAVTGYVPDIRPYLQRATVYVAPLRLGSGIKNKILEAWAMAKPVVSTRLGGAGIPVKTGADVLLAEEPEAFTAAVLTLLPDETLRDRLGRAGRRRVEEAYTWQSRARELHAVLPDAARERPRRHPLVQELR